MSCLDTNVGAPSGLIISSPKSSSNLTSYVELVETSGEFTVTEGSKKVDLGLQYVEGAKPTTKAEYLTMCSELGEELSLTITVAVTAVFVGA